MTLRREQGFGTFFFNFFQEFRASTQPLPQPFLFRFYRSNLAFMPYEEENQKINETLVTINSDAK
jgi:hypothetical protein